MQNRIVLWEIATRRRPWKGVKAKVIVESVLQGSRPKVYEEDKWGKEFTAIVQSAWAQDPAKRPTMKDLKKAITGKDIPCLS